MYVYVAISWYRVIPENLFFLAILIFHNKEGILISLICSLFFPLPHASCSLQSENFSLPSILMFYHKVRISPFHSMPISHIETKEVIWVCGFTLLLSYITALTGLKLCEYFFSFIQCRICIISLSHLVSRKKSQIWT